MLPLQKLKKKKSLSFSPRVEPLLDARRVLGQVQPLRDPEVGFRFIRHDVVDDTEGVARDFARAARRRRRGLGLLLFRGVVTSASSASSASSSSASSSTFTSSASASSASSSSTSTSSFRVHRRRHAPHLLDRGRVRPEHPQQHLARGLEVEDLARREEARAVPGRGEDPGLVEGAPGRDAAAEGREGDLAPLDEVAQALVRLEAAADVVEPARVNEVVERDEDLHAAPLQGVEDLAVAGDGRGVDDPGPGHYAGPLERQAHAVGADGLRELGVGVKVEVPKTRGAAAGGVSEDRRPQPSPRSRPFKDAPVTIRSPGILKNTQRGAD